CPTRFAGRSPIGDGHVGAISCSCQRDSPPQSFGCAGNEYRLPRKQFSGPLRHQRILRWERNGLLVFRRCSSVGAIHCDDSPILKCLFRPLEHFLCRHIFNVCCDGPDVSERILNCPCAIAVKLVLQWTFELCARINSLLDGSVYVFNVEEEADASAAKSLW